MRKLYKHQVDTLNYTLQVRHPALFMEMRLGKTLVAIRRVKLYSIKHPSILVVAPNSALGSWESELKQEKESFRVLQGTRQQRLDLLKSCDLRKWYLVNKEGFLSIPEIARFKWDVVILDESTFIKNPKAKVTKFFLQNFRTVKHRWILTGTPNPESDLDFITQLIFLRGSFCGQVNYWRYRAKYAEPGGYNGYAWRLTTSGKKTLSKELGRLAFTQKRKDVKMDVKKIYEKRIIPFPKDIQKQYDDIEDDFEFNGDTTIWAMEQYIWLRRLCGGFDNDNRPVWDGKLQELKSLLTGELSQDQVVIWFNFNHELHTAAKFLKIPSLCGQNDRLTRVSTINRFNTRKIRFLALQQKIANVGVDLSSADTSIYYSSPVSLLDRQQTEDRIVSIKKKSPLLYIDLVVPNTVDEDILSSLQNKKLSSNITLSKILKNSLERRRRR